MSLVHAECYGDGPPLIILHGLFGGGDNWRTCARQLSGAYQVFTCDLRNHGRSFHSNEMSYQEMAKDISLFIQSQNLDSPIVMGHSMGGKVAMQLAVDFPGSIKALIVVDIAPKLYPRQHDDVLAGLANVKLRELGSRSDADPMLAAHIDDRMLRQFLMKSLVSDDGVFRWAINVDTITTQYDAIAAAPTMTADWVFSKPTLFIRGENSSYIEDSDLPLIHSYFSNSHVMTIPDAGHWLHAEKPDVFIDVLNSFLDSV